MQAVEPCGQEEPLKEVLLTLGLPESELTDMHDVECTVECHGEKAVKWRLNLQSGKPFDNFCVVFGGSCSPLLGIFQTQQEICQQKRLPWDLRPRRGSRNRGRAAKWCRSICFSARSSPAL